MRSADTLCAAEPIHIPGSTQPHGVLLAADAEFVVIAASQGASAALGLQGAPCVGQPITAVLGDAYVAQLRDRLAAGPIDGGTPWITMMQPHETGAWFEAVAHCHDGLIIVEALPLAPDDGLTALAASHLLQRGITALRQGAGGDLASLARIAARFIRKLTGYERVLVYRFDDEWHGQAIAEDKVDDWGQSLDGLHFPASDIPAQARQLYRRSAMRWVPASRARPLPLDVAIGWARPIDLSFACLRSLSPVHLQYHRNMGVEGSMSVSIMHRGELWGLLVCHHRAGHHPSPGQRAAAVALTDAFALRIETAERSAREQARQADARRLDALLAHLAEASDVGAALTDGETTMASLFTAAGAAVCHDGALRLVGHTPPEAAVAALIGWLAGRPEGELFCSNHLAAHYPEWSAYAAEASGLLAVFLSADRRDVLLWFRPEETELVAWGGNPNKPLDEARGTLPRLSFERWVEERHGYARPWEDWAFEIALSLRHAITEVIIRSLRRIAVLQSQLHQSQKMEAVGQLTGGLAHDFNNLLTGILGSLEICRKRIAQGRADETPRFVDAAMQGAERAGALTRRLLDFSRGQPLDPVRTNIAAAITSMQELIRRSLAGGSAVEGAIAMEVLVEGLLWTVVCDTNQFENALLNLAINARDAMPQGGRLVIAAANASFSGERALQHGVAGEHVVVTVADSGSGMTQEVAARAFEPFYSTKPAGQGTGLGLAMVYGFARQSGGHVRIESELGVGTAIHLYLPRAPDAG